MDSKITADYLDFIKPSATLKLVAKAIELKSKGIDILSLSVGEPDFDTPDNIKNAAIRAINEGKTKYTAADGILALKDAIIKKFQRDNQLSYVREQITVGCGGKQVIFNCFLATINPGDEVIIPAPYWVSYPDMVMIARGKPVFVQTREQDNFKLNAKDFAAKITHKTKWLILNSPSNPSGQIYSKEELFEIVQILRKYTQILILSDDIYENLVYDNKFYNIASIAPDIKDRVLIVNGVSKTYAMTGWRIGYGAGSQEIIKKMTILQSQSTSNACSISQYAALEALTGDQNFIEESKKLFKERRNLAHKLLNNIPGITCQLSGGAFYLFVNCSKFLGMKSKNDKTIETDKDFCEYLLEDSAVAVVPGSEFGIPGYFRFSYAVSNDIIIEAIRRISESCKNLN